MLRMFVFLAISLVCLAGCSQAVPVNQPVDLSGTWQFQLGSPAAKKTMAPPAGPLKLPAAFNDTILLPGTTDTNLKGLKTTGSTRGTYTRRYRHVGRAWYHRSISIPTDWNGKDIELFIERALWETTVYLDGQQQGSYDSLAAPHIYNLGPITPGKHTLTICVDNSMIYNIGDKSHSYSENMQTVWNGMLGKLELRPLETIRIRGVRSRLSPADSKASQCLMTLDNTTGKPIKCSISLDLTAPTEKNRTSTIEVLLQPGVQKIECPLPDNLIRWDEFKPHLYNAQIVILAGEKKIRWQGKLGFCQPGSDGTHITINGRPTYLRGNLDNCHFPLTGHPPMNKAGWLRVWNIYKQFGYNHVRFHSWCPPEAAFAAADEAGIYIQAEAGVWIDGWMKGRVASRPNGISDKNPGVRDFVGREMKRIIDAYGHHPSFVMFCIGNELGSSNFDTLSALITQTRQYDDTSRLYSCSTARRLQPDIDDYYVSHQNSAGSMRGLRGPKTDWTYDNVKRGAPKTPLILHELGQWPIWPAWSEIDKYTGVVEARNLQRFREIARKNNVLSQDTEFQSTTGKFSVLLYKAEMEGALRSKTYSGFHSLGLQDYMGQGEAMIGILDMFYDLKPGTITAQQYRQFCSPVVPLAQFEKYTWTSGETFTASLEISNFSAGPLNYPAIWKLTTQNGKTLGEGVIEKKLPQGTVTELGQVSVELETQIPLACTLELAVKGSPYKNTWPIWVYPATREIEEPKTVTIADGLNTTSLQALSNGETVLLMAADCMTAKNAHRNTFIPVYWSVGWFPRQPKTLGLTCEADHKLFKLFPNNGHCDWQWHDIVNDSSAMILNGLPADYRPLVQPVDDFHTARKLGAIFESKVGNGKLLVCVYPLRKRLSSPACRNLYAALLEYAASEDFQPKTELPIDWLRKNLTSKAKPKVSQQNPIGSAPAALWVQVGEKTKAFEKNTPYSAHLDVVRTQKSGYGYTLIGDGAWRDAGGRFIFGKKLTLKISLPKGVQGTVYVKFNDSNRNGRTGEIVFENRRFELDDHTGEKGLWLEFNVMREDALDNTLELTATVKSGSNLQIDEFVLIPVY